MSAATKTIYCKMAQDWWKADGAAVGAYYWGTGTAPAWPGVRMTPVEGETDLWSIDVDTDKYQNIIFTRVNGSGTVSDWGAKTADLKVPTDEKNLYTITSTSPVWGNPGVKGEWSVYTTSTPDPTPDPEPEPEPEPEPSTGVVYNVTVPAGTHACYIAGEMTGWSQTEMTKVDNTHYTITIAEATEAQKYKYCSGPDWSYVEVTADGGNVADRTYSAADVVAKWATVYNPSVEPEPAKDITIKAQIPAAWTNTITAWVWYVGESGKEVTLTKDGDWYVHTENCPGLNIIIKNGEGWTGDANQTVDMTFSEDACIAITAGDGKATYTVVDCEGGVTPDPEPTPAAYYVVGTFNSWTNPDPATVMTEEGGVYTKILTLEAGECQIKVTNGTWDDGGNWGYDALTEVPAGVTRNNDGNIVFTLAEAGDVKVTFNGTNVTVAGDFYVSSEPDVVTYVLMGVAGDWTTGIELTLNVDNTEYTEYMLIGQAIAEGDAVKVVTLTNGTATAWCGNVEEGVTVDITYDEMGNIVLAPGTYDFYFKPEADIIYIGGIATEPEVPVYEVYEDVITNLVFDLESWPMVCTGGPSEMFQVEVFLVLGEDDGNGKFYLTEESSISVMGSDANFIDGYLENIDAYAPAADAVIHCEWNGMNLEFHLAMSAAPVEATVVVVENATVVVDKYHLFGDVYDYSLTMTGTWTDEEGLEYPVLVEVPVYYPEATEPNTILSTVTVGGWEETDNWLGFGEGELEITTVDGVVTATGIVENPMAGIAIDITISGTLPEGPTGLENLDTTAAPAKVIENGQLIIIRDGVKYNAVGATVK